jgi:serine/threonine protein kinase
LWGQGELVSPSEVPKNLLTNTDAVSYLGDFGLATKAGTEVRHKMLLPRNIVYYAPERFHNVNSKFVSDMWSYMCLFTHLYLGHTPWYSYSYVSVITDMVRTLGPLPKNWKGYYNAYGICGNSWYI